eukprot:jgi/Mesen1/3401/ME000192S02575
MAYVRCRASLLCSNRLSKTAQAEGRETLSTWVRDYRPFAASATKFLSLPRINRPERDIAIEPSGISAHSECTKCQSGSSNYFHRNANGWRGYRLNNNAISCQILRRIRNYHAARTAVANADAGIGDVNVDIFDRNVKRLQRDRAAMEWSGPDPVQSEVTERLLDRLEDCKRAFPVGLVLEGAGEHVRSQLAGRGGLEKLIMLDSSAKMLEISRASVASELLSGGGLGGAADDGAEGLQLRHPAPPHPECSFIAGDAEFLPLRENSVDVVISVLGLHWINDLPGAMTQCRMALKPDGLFLAAMFGGDTLKEMRIACTVAQMEREGGISPRVSPLAQVRDAGNLLTRAGLALPTVDVDEIIVRYPSAVEVVEHLRAMGEGNAVRQRSPVLRRDTALATAAVYQSMFGAEDGSVIYMAGWSPHPSQQRPRARGSASVSLKDIQGALGDAKMKKGAPQAPGEDATPGKAAEPAPAPTPKDGGVTQLPSGSWYKLD